VVSSLQHSRKVKFAQGVLIAFVLAFVQVIILSLSGVQ